MTETYCRSCRQTVHITHSDDDCPKDDADIKTPDHLKPKNVHKREGEEPGGGW
jgi:hypothetical protein